MSYRILQGDCVEQMREMDEASVDAICTDPPYGLEFMGKEWDRFAPQRTTAKVQRASGGGWGGYGSYRSGTPGVRSTFKCRSCGGWSGAFSDARRKRQRPCECEQPDFDYAGAPPALVAFQAWATEWATEALRVLKPGGHLLAFGGTRTYHRLACAVEDAGFEIRDSLIWLYGSGFPKSLDVGKAIDRADNTRRPEREAVGRWLREQREAAGLQQKEVAAHWPSVTGGLTGCVANWEGGFGCPTLDQWADLKALLDLPDDMDAEVWRLNGRKGQPGENWEKREKIGEATGAQAESTGRYGGWGNDADGDGISTFDLTAPATPEAQQWQGWGTALKPAHEPVVVARKPLAGTVAANVLEHGTGALNIDASRIEGNVPQVTRGAPGANFSDDDYEWESRGLSQPHAAGRWPANVALSPEAAAELDRQSGERRSAGEYEKGACGGPNDFQGPASIPIDGLTAAQYSDTGGASRFFYTAKASRSERSAGLPEGERSSHPTVKPIDLMRWLVRLVTPPGGTCLDPFLGSGTTGIAAHLEGFDFIGIEREAEYAAIAEARIKWWSQFPPGTDVDAALGLDGRERVVRESGQLGLEIA